MSIKKLFAILSVSAALGFSAVAALSNFAPVHADDSAEQTAQYNNSTNSDSRKVVHIFTLDYPPDGFIKYPSNAASTTEFWRAMDVEMKSSRALALTENVEEANYRVELRCAGIVHCTKLKVNIMSPKRDILAAYVLKGTKRGPLNLEPTPYKDVAHRLTTTLQERIDLLEQGGYGTYR